MSKPYAIDHYEEVAYTLSALCEPRKLSTVQFLVRFSESYIGTLDLMRELGLGEDKRDADMIGYRRALSLRIS